MSFHPLNQSHHKLMKFHETDRKVMMADESFVEGNQHHSEDLGKDGKKGLFPSS
jgi:hypothetical protein